jgi:hypothetical protein
MQTDYSTLRKECPAVTAPVTPGSDTSQDEIPKCPVCGCCPLKTHCADRVCGWLKCNCEVHPLDKVVYRQRDMHLSGAPTDWGNEGL